MESISLNKFHKILETGIDRNCSDIHLTADKKVYLREKNKLITFDEIIFSKEDIDVIVQAILTKRQYQQFKEDKAIDCAYSYIGRRFRLNIYSTVSGTGIAIRLIGECVIPIDSFAKAEILKKIMMNQRGLILVCGATGTGKSTTLASMIDYLNSNMAKHIITLEDPIEFIFDDIKSLIHQREYQNDFFDFAQAVKMAVRQDPDVIMIGEIRDTETMKVALNAAETGHLVLGTLHASSAVEVLLRIEGFFEQNEINIVRTQLANCLNSIIVQQLIPIIPSLSNLEKDLICCMEILLANNAMKNIIRQGYIQQVNSQIQLNRKQGMQLMKDAIGELVEKRLIDKNLANVYLDKD